MDVLTVVLGLGGIGAPLGIAVGAALGRGPGRTALVGVAVLAGAVYVALWLLTVATSAEDCEGESCGLGMFLFGLAIGANAIAWMLGVAVGIGLRRLGGHARRAPNESLRDGGSRHSSGDDVRVNSPSD